MKPFQNPYVVGGLAVVALALIFRNAIAPVWGRLAHRATPGQTAAQALPASPVMSISETTAETPVPKTTRLQPETNINLTQAGWKSNSAPQREPNARPEGFGHRPEGPPRLAFSHRGRSNKRRACEFRLGVIFWQGEIKNRTWKVYYPRQRKR